MPANQIVAASVYVHGSPLSGCRVSQKTRKAPMMSDDTSLASGESWMRSSSTPATNIAMAASGIGSHSAGGTPAFTCETTALNPRTAAIAIPTPPIVGVGSLCHRSARGGTTAPTDGAIRRTDAQSATDASSEITKASERYINEERA